MVVPFGGRSARRYIITPLRRREVLAENDMWQAMLC